MASPAPLAYFIEQLWKIIQYYTIHTIKIVNLFINSDKMDCGYYKNTCKKAVFILTHTVYVASHYVHHKLG